MQLDEREHRACCMRHRCNWTQKMHSWTWNYIHVMTNTVMRWEHRLERESNKEREAGCKRTRCGGREDGNACNGEREWTGASAMGLGHSGASIEGNDSKHIG